MRNRNLLQSFACAWQGLLYALKTQRNMRIHLLAFILVIAFSFILHLSRGEFLWIWLAATMVICLELVNTALEAVVDLAAGQEWHRLAAIAKDVAAGAVLLAAIHAMFVGLLVFGPRLLALFSR
ncbi:MULTISPECIES: diacylglycerol kinase family protein [Carboxydocella]|uniref:Diacylglycerol kinase (ATP) n=2 Tax=Carboxydocella TaxID=178898 RepID=A0A1T4NHM6_9FIRM|nr:MULTISPECIES: diacylglycerol kinase family protein [Carboxydocella]AVX20029.1 diacylglycerol kinase (ATP) [Carboxydocella thermautotrophica]AVX30445.1 diacylglycerol kinase (ATP) [Carboxydocella thermautotrophica]SJZ78268.1 diacylglycerol kinase (ATP) [Carboxydocella sporoproducens DSM 16521]GAW30186.1 diacylglycerol kinase [Carboxydocella sp. ULO1]GAW32319.1 diacylglycerol kinase [Carboxydocella sp. JDF658]